MHSEDNPTSAPSTSIPRPKNAAALPIDSLLGKIIASLGQTPNLVLEAATGAGKTTRVPPALLAAGVAGPGRILMLEPRRIAARAAARRIAEENGWRLGEEVGYQIRYDKKFGPRTRILIVTEGILVSLLQRDPFLEKINILLFDEVHERSVHTDLSLAMARRVQREVRPDLKLIAMSATLEAGPLREFLGGCPLIASQGRSFPVQIDYLQTPDTRPLPQQVAEGVRRALQCSAGDLLVFLPGVGEIRRSADLLAPLAGSQNLTLLRLYGDLSPREQDAILRPQPSRKVVLATNVAETSLTIEGITGVVDCGLAKSMRFDPSRGLNRLQTGRISRAAAEQRAGRAGRQGPGHCLRLWTEHDQRNLMPRETPEILRTDLAATALQLLAWGEKDLATFDWLEAPEPASLEQALGLLSDLGANNASGVTELGRRMARLPLHPRLARLLLAGEELGVGRSAALAAALLSERDVVQASTPRLQASYSTDSDLLDRLRCIRSLATGGNGECAAGRLNKGRTRQLLRLRDEIARSARLRADSLSGAAADQALARALLAAYPDRLARRRPSQDGRGLLVGGRGVRLSGSSSVRQAELFLALEVSAGRSEGWVQIASAVDPAWLPKHELQEKEEVVFDRERGRVVGLRRSYYRDLILAETEVDPGQREAEQALVAAAKEDLEKALPLTNKEIASFLARCRWLGGERPDLGIETFGPERLVELLPAFAAGCRSFAQLRRAPLLQILHGALDFQAQKHLATLAPESYLVPSGSQIRLHYEPGKAPILAVRIQELFGLAKHPCLAGGRVPILLHVLAPNMRPQQVTQDLESFWLNTYPQVKSQLQGRYPKHSWPENPLTARAEKRPRRKRI